MLHSRLATNLPVCPCCNGFECGSRVESLAENSGDRTHQGRLTPLTGFEDRAPHQGAILFLAASQTIYLKMQRQASGCCLTNSRAS